MKYEFDLINELDAVKSETFYNKANGGVKFNSRDLPRQQKQIKQDLKRSTNKEFLDIGRKNLEVVNSDPTHIKIKRERLKLLNQDPDIIKKRIEVLTLINNNAEQIRIKTERLKVINQNPENIRKKLDALKLLNQNPEHIHASKERLKLINNDPLLSKKKIEKSLEKTAKKVKNIQTGIVYKSAGEAEKLTGEPNTTISRHCNKKVKCPNWEFVD